MKLTDIVKEIYIDPRKLTDYALNTNSPYGKHKAVLFEKLLGFTIRNYTELTRQIEIGNMIGKNAEIIILTESDEQFSSGDSQADKKPGTEKAFSASALLKYAGSWSGDDLEHCLEELHLVRGEAEF